MSYTISEQHKIAVLAIDDLLNPLDNQKIIDEITVLLQQGKREWVVDLSSMSFMNSSGLTFLINLLTRTRNVGGDLVIVGVSPRIQQVLLVTRLQSMFAIRETLQEGVDFFDKATKED